MKPRVACILAAGVGSRLRPLTDDKPKALVPVSGKTILERAVSHLLDFGVQKLVIATGYREDALRRALSNLPAEVVYCPNPDYATTQNSVSLALCRHALSGEDFLRLDGDVVFDSEILSRLSAVDAPLVAAVDRARMLDAEAMKVRLEPDQRHVQAFGKGIPLSESGGESIGIELLRRDAGRAVLDGIDEAVRAGETNLYYEDVYSRLIPKGLRVGVADVTDVRWSEVDSPEDLAAASRLFPA